MQQLFAQNGIIKPGTDIRELSLKQIEEAFGKIKAESAHILKGLGASPGTARGRVAIIKDMNDVSKFKEGDVLVTKITDPTMTVIMGMASAIVCDIGSIVSHPSIISRELGIPCVVATKNATTALKDGDLVEVDGEKGIITVIPNVN